MKKIRKILIIIMLATAINTVAQSGYQSFLNGDTIQWYVNQDEIEEGFISYLFSTGDTAIIDNLKCKELKYKYVWLNNDGTHSYQEYPTNTIQFLSEDTLTGKLWLIYRYSSDTTPFIKKLIVDMSLNVGDTFFMPLIFRNRVIDTFNYVVDSVLYINNRKHIFMRDRGMRNLFYGSNIFIEGVGSTHFLFYPIGYNGWEEWDWEFRLLSCCYKNGLSVFRDLYYFYLEENDDCVMRRISITSPEATPSITAYPNPTKDRVTLEFGEARFSTLRLVNTAGATVLETALTGHEPQLTLQLKDLPAGIYSCILSGKDGTATQKIVVE